jgi:DNA-binding PadR family transcriptional regulator
MLGLLSRYLILQSLIIKEFIGSTDFFMHLPNSNHDNQQLFDNSLNFCYNKYVVERHISNRHKRGGKGRVMLNQDLPTEEEIPSGLTPLREPTLFIMLALSKGRKHGYAILKDVEVLSEGRVVLSTGTLYGALARLLGQGVIRKSGDDDGENSSGSISRSGSADVRVRKYYELTQFGHRVLEVEINRMGKILAMAGKELSEEGI